MKWFFIFLSVFLSRISYGRSFEEIQKSKEIRACIAAGQDSIFDFSKRQAELFAESLGLKMVVKRLIWDELFHHNQGVTLKGESYTPLNFENGHCDFYPSGLSILDWRLKLMDMVPVWPMRMMVVIHKDHKMKYKKREDLGGKLAGVIKSSSYEDWLLLQNEKLFKNNPVKIEYLSLPNSLEFVSKKKIDFTIFDGHIAFLSTRDYPSSILPIFPIGDLDQLSWGIPKGSKELQKAIEDFFAYERKNNDSRTNKLWLELLGMSFVDFVGLMTKIE